MIICICANISDKELDLEPNLINVIGLGCGKCIEYASNKSSKPVHAEEELLESSSDEVQRPKCRG